MKVVLPKIIFRGWFRAAMSVSYTAFLDVSKDSVLFLSGLLHTERVRRGTRAGTRALSTYRQAVLVLRWFLDDARMAALARDNSIGKSTAYAYLGEAIIALAARRPGLHGALLAAKAAGHTHVILDGTLIATDRALGLADLGYEGEADLLRVPFKKPKGGALTNDQQTYNAVHGALRCLGERANSLLKTTFKALRRIRGCPWRIGDIVAAALVLLHFEHGRTT